MYFCNANIPQITFMTDMSDVDISKLEQIKTKLSLSYIPLMIHDYDYSWRDVFWFFNDLNKESL